MKKIKVLYVITRCTKSGPIQVLENIVKHMDRDRFELYLISINPENEKRTIRDTFSQYFIYRYVPLSKPDAMFGSAKGLRVAIDEICPDVIHSTGAVPDYAIGRWYRDKQIIIAHANVKLDYRMLCGRVKGAVYAAIHIGVMRHARMTVACSESLSKIYKAETGIDMPFIRNGVECLQSDATPGHNEKRNELELPTDKKILVYAASFNNRKNHRFLLQAFSKYYAEDSSCYLLLLGDGSTFEELKAQYGQCAGIDFRGRVYDVKAYLENCDVFVSTSKQEGMPMGVLEAMAEGLPVLLSDIAQHREIYSMNDKIGCMYQSGNEEDFLIQLKKLMTMDLSKSGAEAYSVVHDKYDAAKMSMEYQKAYMGIAES